MKFVLLVIILMASVAMPPVFAHYPHTSDECSTTEKLGSREQCIVEQRESGKEVKFADIFFSEGSQNIGGNTSDEIPLKMEVAPGDGNTILAAVMANSGAFELTGLKGWLSLPIGFKAVGKAVGEPAFDTYDLGIAPGAVFVFEFPVEVSKDTSVGVYHATLHIEYFKARDIGLNFREFNIEFLLPGKSIMDAISDVPVLLPSTVTKPTIKITNMGTAPASGVIVSMGPSGVAAALVETETQSVQINQIINVGKKIFDVGVVEPHSEVVIEPSLYVNPALRDTRQTMIVDITYFDMYGQRKNVGIPINFLVSGITTDKIDFEITTYRAVIPTLTNTPFTLTIENTGTEIARAIEITGSAPSTATVALNQQVPEASKSPIMIIGGDGYYRIDRIEPGGKFNYTVTLFASEEAVNTAYQLPIRIVYSDLGGGLREIQRFVSVYVQGTISLRVYDLGITYIANEPNLSGYLLNEGTNMALFTTVELVDSADALKSNAGPQYLGDLTANSPLPFNIPLKVAEGTGLGEYPVKVRVTYKDDLRNPFDVTMDGTVKYTPLILKKTENPDVFSNMGVFIGAGAAGVAGFYFMRRKRKNGSVKNRTDDDIDFLNDK